MKLFTKYIRLFYSSVLVLLVMQWGTTHETLFINAHFVQNRGERKHWWIKLGYQPPNHQSFLLPMFCAIRYIYKEGVSNYE